MSLEEAEELLEHAEGALEVARRQQKKAESEFAFERRLFKAKMKRFKASVDRNKSSPIGQLERYHDAKEQYTFAMVKEAHWKLFAAQAEATYYACMCAVRDAELAAYV